MAHWSIAYCIGPNYNKPWETFEGDEKTACIALARTSIQAARGLLDHVTPLEHALIDALAARYPETSDIDDFSPWNDAFTDAMRRVHSEFGTDLDVCALFAEALMNRTPWQLWDLPTGKPAEGADTLEAIVALENAFSSLARA